MTSDWTSGRSQPILRTGDGVCGATHRGALQRIDFEATGEWDIVAREFAGVADKLGR
jgi:hypothetical protein